MFPFQASLNPHCEYRETLAEPSHFTTMTRSVWEVHFSWNYYIYISSVYNTAKVEYLLCGSLRGYEVKNTELMVPWKCAFGEIWEGGARVQTGLFLLSVVVMLRLWQGLGCLYLSRCDSFFFLFFYLGRKKMRKLWIPNVFHRCGPIYAWLG